MSAVKKEIPMINDAFTLTTIGKLARSAPIFPKENENEKETPKRRVSIIREFCLNTSTHGLPGIARSQTPANCFFWCLSLASFTGVMLYLIIKAILDYLDYPTQMDIGIISEWPQLFPAFSICNIGAIRFDTFIGPFINFTNSKGWTNTNNTTTINADQAKFVSFFFQDLLNRNQSPTPYYYPLSSMLVRCFYNGQPCSAADFIPFTISTYGLCHTFNAQLKNTSTAVRYGHENGGNGVLDVAFYIHSHQYVPYLVDHSGAAVMVHDNNEVPLVDLLGFELKSGEKYKLSFRKEASYFLPAPFTKCVNEPPLSMEPVLMNYPQANYEYSQSLCYRYVIQIFIYQMCGCVNPSIWEIRYLILPNTDKMIYAPLCSIDNFCYVNASNIYMSQSSNELLNGSYECPQQCSDVDFPVEKSSSKTPMEYQMTDIKRFVENSSIPLPSDWSQNWKTHIRENYFALSLVRETDFVENRTQSSSFSLVDVISNIGGQMGLWIGISLLSFMELLEMLCRLIHYEISTRFAVWKRKQQIQNQI